MADLKQFLLQAYYTRRINVVHYLTLLYVLTIKQLAFMKDVALMTGNKPTKTYIN